MRCLPVILALALASSVHAQSQDTRTDPLEDMEALHFLLGDWEGEGWFDRDGQRYPFVQTERVRSLLGGEVILIEGRGLAADDTSRVIHDAVAVIGYDAEAAQYVMRSFVSGGRGADPEAQVVDGTFIWQIGSNVRYTIRLNEAGQWYEIGEYSRDGGEAWHQFFEMTLDRVE